MRCLVFLCYVFAGAAAHAASPVLSEVMPRGGQRGTELELVLRGDRLAEAQEVFCYRPGVAFTAVKSTNNNEVRVQAKIAADAQPGEYPLRLRTNTGISELRTFYVGTLPMSAEQEPNNDFAKPQKIEINHTVAGVIENEDVDYYVVDCKKGQRLTAEIECIRLGEVLIDPYVAILDTNRFELAASDDTALLLQDSIASTLIPADGAYIIQVRESSYGGAGNARYRLHVGTFPRPLAVYPAGGKAGEELHVRFVGDVAGEIEQTLRLPKTADTAWPAFAEQQSQLAPSPNFLRVSPFENVLEQEPNDVREQATATTLDLPIAVNGIIGKKNDYDWFRFKAKGGQQYHIALYARAIHSPLDSVMTLCDGQGKDIASNDDNGNLDSYIRLAPASDGEFMLCVSDQLHAGGPDYTYRVEITPLTPAIVLSIPQVGIANSQERQTIPVPRGNCYGTLMRVGADFGGAVQLSVADLPKGMTMTCPDAPPGVDVAPVVFEAAADAPLAGELSNLTAKPVDGKIIAPSMFLQTIDMMYGQNNTPFYQVKVDRLAAAVTEAVPFKIEIVQPKAPIVQNGQMQLMVRVQRQPGFNSPVNVRMLFDPPGVGSGQITISGDQSEGLIPLSANGDAAIRKWKIAALANAETPAVPEKPAADGKPAEPARPASGPIWISSHLADFEVVPPMLLAKIEMAATEQGKPVQMTASFAQKTKFEGKAVARLLNLPPNASAKEVEISAADAKATFDVTTDAKTPTGQHNAVFCQVTVMKDGEPVVHNIGQGGVLRVDAPPPPKADAPPVQTAAAPPPAPMDKPLSRLEQLRLEQKAKAAK